MPSNHPTKLTHPPLLPLDHPTELIQSSLNIEAEHSTKKIRAFNHYNGQKPKWWQRADQQLHGIPKTSTSKILLTLTHYKVVPVNQVVFKTEKKMLQEQW